MLATWIVLARTKRSYYKAMHPLMNAHVPQERIYRHIKCGHRASKYSSTNALCIGVQNIKFNAGRDI